MIEKQIGIKSASFRVVHESPGHVIYGVWINGSKSGELTVRQEERAGFVYMMANAGFIYNAGDKEK